jgi:cytochrome c oxidase assembly protein subunit 15
VTQSWLHRFCILTAAATLALIGAGGLVTSHGVGMAVPDWPNTYGYNMFFFPISQWVGGIFYEHSHRLLASGVGLLTTILALWLYGKIARPFLRICGSILTVLGVGLVLGTTRHRADGVVLGVVGVVGLSASFLWPRCEPSPKWLRRMGVVALFAVVLQGVLGGLRVVLFKDEIGIFHATLAQHFFVLTCALALWTRPRWQATANKAPCSPLVSRGLSPLFLFATALILAQLVLGATMRHQHAGLAIPDFPLAYGKLWPAMDPASVTHYNQQRLEVVSLNPITATQIVLQLIHRAMALLILGSVGLCALSARRQLGGNNTLARLAMLWLGLILIQALLGAATIWSNKAADIATLHVVVGALSLASGAMLSIIAFRRTEAVADTEASRPAQTESPVSFGTRPSAVTGLH